MFEVSTTSSHTILKSFREAQYGFVDRVLWQLVPYQLQNLLELIDVLQLGLKWLVVFKHSSPDTVVQRVEVRRVQRPFIFTNEFTAVGSNPVLSQLCHVCRHTVLLKDEVRWQNRSAILNKFRQQDFNIKFSIHFGLVWNEMQSSFPIETDVHRNHDVLGELCSVSYQPTFVDVCVKAGGGYLEHALKWTTCEILVFAKVKVKVWTLVIVPLTWVRLATSSALQSRKWQLIGMSWWCRSTLCGHPLPTLMDNWTHHRPNQPH